MTSQMPVPHPLRLKPVLIERPWGGRRLRAALRKEPHDGLPIGESWELADLPAGSSTFADPPWSGRSFGEVFRDAAPDLFGLPANPRRHYPLLVKFIDAGENLSIQVHPDDAAARLTNSRGKNECWYVVDCAPGCEVLCGFVPGITREALARQVAEGRIEEALVRRPIRPGDFINVPAGTVHAILENALICEISQSSSEIARLWDWGRPSRPDRPIEPDRALAIADFSPSDSRPDHRRIYVRHTADSFGSIPLVANDFFEVKLLSFPDDPADRSLEFDNPHGVIACVVHGSGSWSSPPGRQGAFSLGETWFLPAGLDSMTVHPNSGNLRLLVSRPLRFDP
jgi:mannose-6-phosphate isomerase